jgi:hypothetical protein
MVFKKIRDKRDAIGRQNPEKAANSEGAFIISGLQNPESKSLLGASGERRSTRSVIHIRIPRLKTPPKSIHSPLAKMTRSGAE